MELTKVEFWEDYWKNIQLPKTIDLDFSFDRCLAQALKVNLPLVGGEVFEVGCAPGKWLAFMAQEFGTKPSGIDYSRTGILATQKNFQLLKLTKGFIWAGDFFETKPDRQFDVVMSFGFISHFRDPDKVVELHLQWLKPGGLLILGVPNFRGINYFLQEILDKSILDRHNLDMMQLDYFVHLSQHFNLEPIFLNYIGSFEPTLPIAKLGVDNLSQFMVKSFIWFIVRVRKIKMFDIFNNRLFSAFILAIYKKRN